MGIKPSAPKKLWKDLRYGSSNKKLGRYKAVGMDARGLGKGPWDPHQLGIRLQGPIMASAVATVTLASSHVRVLVTVPGCMAQWHSLSLPGGPKDLVPLPASLWSQGEAQGQ